jgi:hypothetical protein
MPQLNMSLRSGKRSSVGKKELKINSRNSGIKESKKTEAKVNQNKKDIIMSSSSSNQINTRSKGKTNQDKKTPPIFIMKKNLEEDK